MRSTGADSNATEYVLCVSTTAEALHRGEEKRSSAARKAEGNARGEAKRMPPWIPGEKPSCVHFLLAAATCWCLA